MEYVQHIPKTDLARKTRQVLLAVQRGQTTIVENHGQPEAAIIDIVDYRILRAVLRYLANPLEFDSEAGLPDSALDNLDDPQACFDLVLTHYLAKAISLGRVAELLDLAWADLRFRFNRLDVPIFVGPENIEELKQELETLKKWESEYAQSGSTG
ncbi:MAG: hypothetical protein U9Q82_09220 [Chloroflexota bacterium]|nr:hypothetical protein [Chloroflexota bacterium]